jgi:hypothetical protein
MAAKQTLIAEFFENPNPPPTTSYYQYPTYTPPALPTPSSNAFIEAEKTRAEKRNLTVSEYRRRVNLVNLEAARCFLKVGDVVSPADPKNEEKYGKFIVTGIVRHFDDYGTVDWTEPPMILAISQVSNRQNNMTCAPGWLRRQSDPIVHHGACEC